MATGMMITDSDIGSDCVDDYGSELGSSFRFL